MAAAMVALAACGSGDNGESAYRPKPSEVTVEDSSNSMGKRFCFTLDGLSVRINNTVAAVIEESDDGDISLLGEWEILADGLVDNNGVKYTSYKCIVKTWTLTAAVEDVSKKVMNIGCGCSAESLKETNYCDNFLTYAAILAKSAGGFENGDVPFLKGLLYELYYGKDSEVYYETMTYSLSKNDETVVVIISPSSTEAEQDEEV